MSAEQQRWLDRPENVAKLFWGLVGVCALLGGLDLFLPRHTHFGFEGVPVFYGVFGFTAFFLIVLAGKQLRKVLKRREDYYD
jgi:hypothetical protein